MAGTRLPTDSHERELRALGFEMIAGVDEVGRGALAGPVVAAAVVLPAGVAIDGVRDSKMVPEPERERLYDAVTAVALAWSVGVVESDEIDRINIRQATFKAMRCAVETLTEPPDYVLVDGRDTAGLAFPCRAVVGGDALSISIAAASLVAKVTRDRIMRRLGAQYPAYGFAKHKGYGTAEHRNAILAHGPAAEHRRSFLRKLFEEGSRDEE